MFDFKSYLLAELLECGVVDPEILKDVDYSITDLVECCNCNFGKVTLEGLVAVTFSFGLRDLRKSIEERIKEISSYQSLDKAERKELSSLKKLDPDNDTESYFNFLDTSIYFVNNKEIYKKYCKKELDEFYEKTGFEIQF